MLLIIVLVFTGVFAVSAMLLAATGTGASQRTKQMLATLDSALATSTPEQHDPIIDLRKRELLSEVPWINRLLAQAEIAPRLRILLYQADLQWTAGGLLLMSLACCVFPGYLLYLRTGAALFSLLVGLAIGAAPFGYVLFRRSHRFNKFEQSLPDALDLMVSALRAGHSLAAALGLVSREMADPVGGEFRICFDEQNYGLELRTAMENLTKRVPLQDLRMVATAILIQKESGGNLAEVLEKAGHVIRERFQLKRQVRVHTAQGRLTGWILTALPIVLGVLLYLVNPKTMSVLWTREIGIKLLYVSAGMTITGGLIIRKIVNMDV